MTFHCMIFSKNNLHIPFLPLEGISSFYVYRRSGRVPSAQEYPLMSVLVSAGIDYIFFLVAGEVLCFGFNMRIMLKTH